MSEDTNRYEIKCFACNIENLVDFNASNVEISEDSSDIFYLNCQWGKCKHRGEYKFSDLKPLPPLIS
jgi:hypothetical protein